jgi:endonuclease/exonuclease/phosphatase (EEP) superfamily protein YafD
LVCNVLSGNDTPDIALQWLRANPADVAVILEVTPAWISRLETLADIYPHRAFRAREGNFGIAVLSRREWLTVQQVDFTSAPLPSFVVDYEFAGTPLTLIATHPPPPGASGYAVRNRHLQAVGNVCRQAPGRCIVAGDLNATPWCHGFRVLTRSSGLVDTGLGFGFQPTWPILHGLSAIPIDHVLASPDIGVTRRKVGPDIGSDHRPVIVELRIPE